MIFKNKIWRICCLEVTHANIFNTQNKDNLLVAGRALKWEEHQQCQRGSCTHSLPLKHHSSQNQIPQKWFLHQKTAVEQLKFKMICAGLSLASISSFCTCKQQGRAGGSGPGLPREVSMTLGFLAEMPSGIFIVPEKGQWNHSGWHLSTARSLTAALAGNIRLKWLKVKVRVCQITGTVSYLPAAITEQEQRAQMKCEVIEVPDMKQKCSMRVSSLTYAIRPLVLEN